MDFIKSEKGKNKLKLDDYLLFHDRTTPMVDGTIKTYWRCVRYKDLKCPFRAHTVGGKVVSRFAEHNHPVNSALMEKAEEQEKLRESALSGNSPHVVVSTLLANCSSQAAVVLPTKSSMKRNVQRVQEVRDANNRVIRLPNTREEILIPEKFSKTIKGDEFILYDSGASNNRMIVFGTRENLRKLAHHRDWYMDGTFSSSPALFAQLFTIHFLENRSAFPMVFALMPDRKQPTYERLFSELSTIEPTIDPQSVMVDFEMASINAFESSYPDSVVHGCNFHFNQCLLRKIKQFGYWKDYNDVQLEFQKLIKMLAALAFVPEHKVMDGFELISAKFDAKYEDFLTSFEKEWIGTKDRRKQVKPGRYPIKLWNVFGADIRTNNSVEGWHRSFNELMVRNNPSIWRFLNVVQIEQGKNENLIEKFQSGESPPKRLDKYEKLDKRIQAVMAKFDDTDFQDYIKSISYLISVE